MLSDKVEVIDLSHDAQRAVKKAFYRLIPIILVIYIVAFLDRANIGFAKSAFQLDTGIGDAAFAFGAGIFFIGYALGGLPSNLMLERVGASKWFCFLIFCWGILASLMMFAVNDTIFIILRFLLGLTEAGVFPGIVLYLSYWFPEATKGRALGFFYFGGPIALALGSPFSGFLLDLHGLAGMAGWKWMFLLEGLLGVLVGFFAVFILIRGPADAPWLTASEKKALIAVLKSEETQKLSESVKQKPNWKDGLLNTRILHLSLVFFFVQSAVYGLIFYVPEIISTLMGQKMGLSVGLISGIPWLIAMLGIYPITRFSDKNGMRKPLIILQYSIFGVCLILTPFLGPVMAVIILCIGAINYYASTAIYWTLPTRYLTGSAAAVGIALINAIGNLGGFFGPNIKTWAEITFQSHSAGLVVLGSMAIVSSLLLSFFSTRSSQSPVRQA